MTPVRAARKKTRSRAPQRAATRFMVVTGLSGSGKTHAIHALEDLGYFCVDNLPTQLIPTFAELCTRGEAHLERVAIVVDVRERGFLSQFPPVFRKLRSLPGVEAKLIFLEANRSALVRRFSETRRPHPLAPDRSVSEGIDEERKKMLAIRGMADVIVDTSNLTVHELRDAFGRMTRDESTRADMVVNLLSFGFKHGAPTEADLVFDVRFLPNPHFVDRLRDLTGRDARVVRFMQAAQGHAGLHQSPDGVPEVRPSALRDRRQELSDRCDRMYRGAASIGHDRGGAQADARTHAGCAAAGQTS